MREVWDTVVFENKQKLQHMIFPKGIRYNTKDDDCRAPAMDKVFGWTALKHGEMEQKEKGNSPIFMKNSSLVARGGVEPPTSGL